MLITHHILESFDEYGSYEYSISNGTIDRQHLIEQLPQHSLTAPIWLAKHTEIRNQSLQL